MLCMTDRVAAIENLGVKVRGLPRRPRITVLKKEGRRRIENYGSLVAGLSRNFPNVEVLLLSDQQLAAMSLQDQVSSCSSRSLQLSGRGHQLVLSRHSTRKKRPDEFCLRRPMLVRKLDMQGFLVCELSQRLMRM
jgi:hypothetical protein